MVDSSIVFPSSGPPDLLFVIASSLILLSFPKFSKYSLLLLKRDFKQNKFIYLFEGCPSSSTHSLPIMLTKPAVESGQRTPSCTGSVANPKGLVELRMGACDWGGKCGMGI